MYRVKWNNRLLLLCPETPFLFSIRYQMQLIIQNNMTRSNIMQFTSKAYHCHKSCLNARIFPSLHPLSNYQTTFRTMVAPVLNAPFTSSHQQQNLKYYSTSPLRRPDNFTYPSKFQKPTHSIREICEEYEHSLDAAQRIHSDPKTEKPFTLAGRVMSKREASKHLLFLDLTDTSGNNIQVATRRNEWKSEREDFSSVHNIRRGDHIVVSGSIGKTKIGELSIFPQDIHLVSSCWHPLPDEYFGVHDKEVRFRNRHLDLLFNWHLKNDVFRTRAQVIRYIRNYLDTEGFLEVETPILDSKTGGAAAKPFKTHLNEMNMDLRMRIAPELYLKQLVVGGFDKVYELGKIFRNEGMDTTHNPEFTMVEFYEAYNDFEGLVSRTETLLSGLVKQVKGSYKFKAISPTEEEVELDFTPPFRRLSYLGTIEEAIGQKLPHSSDANCTEVLLDLCKKHDIETDDASSYATLIDKLAGKFVEPLCVQPTFLVDQPIEISPLAKPYADNPEITQRFEMFVLGNELCNAYVELNDPDIQRSRFDEQSKISEAEERHEKDDEFCRVLEYGLPPTVGFGCGVDRLVMLLTGQTSIREVQFYPLMKPKMAGNEEASNTEKSKQQ